MSTEIILGPPGTGKTTTLLNRVADALAAGVKPWRIGYFAFTVKAAQEAVDRAVKQFPVKRSHFTYFRTLHSLAFRETGLSPEQVFGKSDFIKIGKELGMKITTQQNSEDGLLTGYTEDDRIVFIENLSRVRQIDLKESWYDQNDNISWARLERYCDYLKAYKESKGLFDYTDMLQSFLDKKKGFPEFDLLVIDEAQDLSEIQWQMVDILRSKAKHTVIAGDDDQAIYRWAGASIDRFLSLEGDQEHVLEQSYRIPKAVHEVSDSIASRMNKRKQKIFKSRGVDGKFFRHNSLRSVDLSQGEWLILARNRYLLNEAMEHCEQSAYNYQFGFKRALPSELALAISRWPLGDDSSEEDFDLVSKYVYRKDIDKTDQPWHEVFRKLSVERREKILSMEAKGEELGKEPRIKLSTIHGAKGGEADNVLLYTDVSYKAHQEQKRNYDDEARVFYVGATRAKEALHLMNPASNLFFRI